MLSNAQTPRIATLLETLLIAAAAIVSVPLLAQTNQPATQPATRPAVEEPAEKKLQKPELLAVKFDAEWCGYCREMKPKLKESVENLKGEPVLFITLDYTNETTKHQAELLAAALGLEEVWEKNAGSTGRLYLLEAGDKGHLDTLTHDLTADEITEKIKGKL